MLCSPAPILLGFSHLRRGSTLLFANNIFAGWGNVASSKSFFFAGPCCCLVVLDESCESTEELMGTYFDRKEFIDSGCWALWKVILRGKRGTDDCKSSSTPITEEEEVLLAIFLFDVESNYASPLMRRGPLLLSLSASLYFSPRSTKENLSFCVGLFALIGLF